MVARYGDGIQECLQDDQCKTCVKAINKVDTRDQVASYYTIVSYKSVILKNPPNASSRKITSLGAMRTCQSGRRWRWGRGAVRPSPKQLPIRSWWPT